MKEEGNVSNFWTIKQTSRVFSRRRRLFKQFRLSRLSRICFLRWRLWRRLRRLSETSKSCDRPWHSPFISRNVTSVNSEVVSFQGTQCWACSATGRDRPGCASIDEWAEIILEWPLYRRVKHRINSRPLKFSCQLCEPSLWLSWHSLFPDFVTFSCWNCWMHNVEQWA